MKIFQQKIYNLNCSSKKEGFYEILIKFSNVIFKALFMDNFLTPETLKSINIKCVVLQS
jgi:hypothetical protein